MTSPRSGFRRAAVASWTLAGIGVAGVAGASALAYAETYHPTVAEAPAPEAVEPAVVDAPVNLPPAPPVVLPPPTVDTPPAPVVTEAPAQTYTPKYTPEPTSTPKYTQAPVVQQAPVQQAPVQQAPKSSFPIRQSHVPSGGGQTSGGNSFSPHVTVSRGS